MSAISSSMSEAYASKRLSVRTAARAASRASSHSLCGRGGSPPRQNGAPVRARARWQSSPPRWQWCRSRRTDPAAACPRAGGQSGQWRRQASPERGGTGGGAVAALVQCRAAGIQHQRRHILEEEELYLDTSRRSPGTSPRGSGASALHDRLLDYARQSGMEVSAERMECPLTGKASSRPIHSSHGRALVPSNSSVKLCAGK